MAKTKTQYRCSTPNCGRVVSKWQGQCDGCGEWNTFVEYVESVTASKKNTISYSDTTPQRLKNIKTDDLERIIIPGWDEFNRTMGGGIIKDSVTAFSAPPGMGKSTLLLMIGNEVAKMGYQVFCASGEESLTQIKNRANRICKDISDNLWLEAQTDIDIIEAHCEQLDADLVIIDSAQTLEDTSLSSTPGSPTQVEQCTKRLIKSVAKNEKRPRAVFIIAQMTKDDEMAGRQAFRHAVDAVLVLEGNDGDPLKILRVDGKNRFGDTSEVGCFLMEENGFVPVANPSEYFITERTEPVAGSALTVTREGNRNFIVEIEALASRPIYAYPKRTWEKGNRDLLDTLLQILEQRANLPVSEKDVTIKVMGGLRLKEPAVNLSIIMAIVSSVFNKPITTKTICIGDVGLTGEIKKVNNIESRIKEADRLGFDFVFVPKNSIRRDLSLKKIKIVEVNTVLEIIQKMFKS